MYLMALGMFIFDIGSLPFSELQRKSDWQHVQSPRMGARDAVQYTGIGAETINLSGSVYAEISDGRASIDALRTMANTGDAMPLVDGTGTVYGDYVVTAIDESQSYLMANGRAKRIDFTIDLLRFDDPTAVDPAQPGADTPPALAPVTDAANVTASVQDLASNVATDAQSLSSRLGQATNQLLSEIAPIAQVGQNALGGVARALTVVNDLQSSAHRALSQIASVSDPLQALNVAQNLASDASRLITVAESSNMLLRQASDGLATVANVTLAAQNAMATASSAVNSTISLVRQTASQAAMIKGNF